MTYPCYSGVLLAITLHNILSKPLAAFLQNNYRNNGQERRINPVMMTIIEPWEEHWVHRASNCPKKIIPQQKSFNSFPNNKILDWSKLEAFADNQKKSEWKIQIRFGKGWKHCGKRRKCGLPGFSPFPTMFSKALCFRVIKVGIVW